MRWDRLFADLDSQFAAELAAEEHELSVEEERLRWSRLELRDRLVAWTERPAGPTPGVPRAPGQPADPRQRRGQVTSLDPAPSHVVLETVGGAVLRVHVAAVGRDWAAGRFVGASDERTIVIPLASIASIRVPTTAPIPRGEPDGVDHEGEGGRDGGSDGDGDGESVDGAGVVGIAAPGGAWRPDGSARRAAAQVRGVHLLRDLARRRIAIAVIASGETRHGKILRVARDHLDLIERDPAEAELAVPAGALRIIPLARIDYVII